MEIIKVWNGKLPNYWDITQWSVVNQDKLYMLNKESGERTLTTVDLTNLKVNKVKTVSNVILGIYNHQIILGRILDARSHLSLVNVTSYNLESFKKTWRIKESFLFEKYKVPYIKRSRQWTFGKRSIDLVTGDVSLVTLEEREHNVKKLVQDFDSTNFRGAIGNFLFFVDILEKKLTLLNPKTKFEKEIKLANIKLVNENVDGDFDYDANIRLNNSTINNVLINSQCAVWVTNDNNLAVHFFNDGKEFEIQNRFKDLDLCLNSITDKTIVLYGIKSYEEGSILIINMGDLINGFK